MVLISELKEGTFLALEAIQEYENSGDHIRAQGKYQGKPRRGIWEGYGLLATFGGYWFSISWKILIDVRGI